MLLYFAHPGSNFSKRKINDCAPKQESAGWNQMAVLTQSEENVMTDGERRRENNSSFLGEGGAGEELINSG